MKECYLPGCPDYFSFTFEVIMHVCVFFFSFQVQESYKNTAYVQAVTCSIESTDVY